MNTEPAFSYDIIQQKLYDYEDGKIDYPQFTEYLNMHAHAYAEKKNKELLEWKESAMKVMNEVDLQAIGKEIGVQLGASIGKSILPWIRNAKAKGLLRQSVRK